MNWAELRLPRLESAETREPELLDWLRARTQPLWLESKLEIPEVELTAPLAAALSAAAADGQLIRSLEGAERALGTEQRGLALVDARSSVPRQPRVSRLIVLSRDGAQRFYRNAEVLLRNHAPRLLALRVQADAEQLGSLLFGPGETARLALLTHKQAVAATLLSLLPPAPCEPG